MSSAPTTPVTPVNVSEIFCHFPKLFADITSLKIFLVKTSGITELIIPSGDCTLGSLEQFTRGENVNFFSENSSKLLSKELDNRFGQLSKTKSVPSMKDEDLSDVERIFVVISTEQYFSIIEINNKRLIKTAHIIVEVHSETNIQFRLSNKYSSNFYAIFPEITSSKSTINIPTWSVPKANKFDSKDNQPEEVVASPQAPSTGWSVPNDDQPKEVVASPQAPSTNFSLWNVTKYFGW